MNYCYSTLSLAGDSFIIARSSVALILPYVRRHAPNYFSVALDFITKMKEPRYEIP